MNVRNLIGWAGRLLFAATLSLTVAAGIEPRRASAIEPVTVAAAASVAGQLLQLFLRLSKSGDDPGFTISAQNREYLRSLLRRADVGDRKLDEIIIALEATHASVRTGDEFILAALDVLDGAIADVPGVVINDVRELLDHHRLEELFAIMDTIEDHLGAMPPKPNGITWNRYRSEAFNAANDTLKAYYFERFIPQRTEIFNASVGSGWFVEIIQDMYLLEGRMWDHFEGELGDGLLTIYRKAYTERIDIEFDVGKPGSLMQRFAEAVNIRQCYEKDAERLWSDIHDALAAHVELDLGRMAALEVLEELGFEWRRRGDGSDNVLILPDPAREGGKTVPYLMPKTVMRILFRMADEFEADVEELMRRQEENGRKATELEYLRSEIAEIRRQEEFHYAPAFSTLAQFADRIGHDVILPQRPHSCI